MSKTVTPPSGPRTRKPRGAGRRKARSSSAGNVTRFSVSLPDAVAVDLDEMIEARGLSSRSQALTEMIRRDLIAHESESTTAMLAGTITLVYRDLPNEVRARITKIQRRYLKEILTSQHAFLEKDHSLEVLLVQGPAPTLRKLRDELLASRGVSHAQLTLTGTLIPPLHEGRASKRA